MAIQLAGLAWKAHALAGCEAEFVNNLDWFGLVRLGIDYLRKKIERSGSLDIRCHAESWCDMVLGERGWLWLKPCSRSVYRGNFLSFLFSPISSCLQIILYLVYLYILLVGWGVLPNLERYLFIVYWQVLKIKFVIFKIVYTGDFLWETQCAIFVGL